MTTSGSHPSKLAQLRRRAPLPTALRWALGLALLAVIIWWSRPLALLDALSRVSIKTLVMLFPVLAFGVLLQSASYVLLFRNHVGWTPDFFARSARAWAWGTLTPARLGELSLLGDMRAHGVDWPQFLRGHLYLRLVTLWTVAVAALYGCFRLGFLPISPAPLTAALGLAVASAAAIFISRPFAATALQWHDLRPRRPYRRALNWLLHFPRPSVSLLIIGLQLIRLLVLVGAPFLAFRALAHPIPYADTLAVIPWARLFGMLPISVNGIGLREGVQVTLFRSLLSVDLANATAATLCVLGANHALALSALAIDMLARPFRRPRRGLENAR